jgi:hypothetical protein
MLINSVDVFISVFISVYISVYRRLASERWDKADPSEFRGTYGQYLTHKVSKVFPGLAAAKRL